MLQPKIPLVTVIVFTRNTPFMILKQCIASIEQQTLSNIEILLLDANDSDSPYKTAIDQDSSLLKRVTRIQHPEENGFVTGKQKALEQARGSYITFLSAQDTMAPKRLELAINTMKEKELFLLYTNVDLKEKNVLEEEDYQFSTDTYYYLSQLIVQKSCFQLIGGFDEKLVAHYDLDLWLRIHLLTTPFLLSSPDAVVHVCADLYPAPSPFESAIGYRQFYVKYQRFFKEHKNYRKKLYQAIAQNYKESHLFFRYLQFLCKSVIIKEKTPKGKRNNQSH